jgi:2'-5' RNA ligase
LPIGFLLFVISLMMKMFFIALLLPEELNEKVLEYKKYMQERYGCSVALRSPAHITLVPPFWFDENNEPDLIQSLKNFEFGPKFTLTTHHFSSFPPRTLFIALEPSEELNFLKERSDLHFRQSGLSIPTDTRPFHPHITIATRDLHKKDFHESWTFFKEKKFRHSFKAERLSLMKHNGSRWEES